MRGKFCWSFLMMAAVGLPESALAQFVGDVFFVQPSIAAAPDSTTEVELAFFSGAKPFGAARVVLTFDPQKLKYEGISAVKNGDVSLKVAARPRQNQVNLIAVNGGFVDEPFGTVSLARIKFKVLGAVGDRVQLSTSTGRALFSDRSVVAPGTGFSGEIVIVSPATSVQRGQSIRSFDGSGSGDLQARAQSMRPPGHVVRLVVPGNSGLVAEAIVRTPARSTVRD